MEILHREDLYRRDDEDQRPKFCYAAVVYRSGHALYSAISPAKPGERILTTTLRQRKLIPLDQYAPDYRFDEFQVVPSTVAGCRVTQPYCPLTYFAFAEFGMSFDLLFEASALAYLSSHHHPNFVRFLRVRVEEGRFAHADAVITGLCFEQYGERLMHRFNPKRLPKNAAAYAAVFGNRAWSSAQIDECLGPTEAALEHLRGLGYAHNNVNPHSIAFSTAGVPLLKDFRACREIGKGIEEVNRRVGWYDDLASESEAANDCAALAEIREWLSNDLEKAFMFQEFAPVPAFPDMGFQIRSR